MRTAIFFIFACLSFSAGLARIHIPEEYAPNNKRFIPMSNSGGLTEMYDLGRSNQFDSEPLASHVTYYLYTKENLDDPHIVLNNDARQLGRSPHFDIRKQTVFLIHGWMDNYEADVNTLLKQAILSRYYYNVIVVDWSPIAKKLYLAAKKGTLSVGEYVGDFINQLNVLYKTDGSRIIVIGHSLGAHISGIAGSRTNSKISHIIGLDPAGPFYNLKDLSARLDPTDGAFVEVIHTSSDFLGIASSVGHVDHYPNGGKSQPGCGLDVMGACSHGRSFEYLAEAIIQNDSYFLSTQCDSFANFAKNKCDANKKIHMGQFGFEKIFDGDYFLQTRKKAPFSVENKV